MSPEQVAGRSIDARSDIFSFGVVLYELLTGLQPFAGATELEVLQKIQHHAPQPLGPQIPPALRLVVEKAIEKDAADRYQTMQEVVIDLRRLVRQSAEIETSVPTRKRPYLAYAAAAVVLAAAVSIGLWWRSANTPGGGAGVAPVRSIAVLPLQNLSRDPDQEFFSDGMTEALISSLAQLNSIDVISRTSVMRFKGTTKGAPEIGRELGVDAIVEGSVQRAGGRVRISAQLVRAATATNLWARDFDRDATDVLGLQADVARAIAQQIRLELTPEASKRLSKVRPMKPEALEAYLMGKFHFWKQNESALKEAITYFERAITVQDDYAEAHAALSEAWGTLHDFGFRSNAAARRSEALRALELDPNLSDAHAALAAVAFEDWDWDGAERAFRRALELNPDSINACACYGNALIAWGRVSEAIEINKHAELVNPLSPFVHFNHGFVLYMSRQFDEAMPHFKRSIELEPQYRPAYALLSYAYGQTGKTEDALAVINRPEFQGSWPLGRAFVQAGRRPEALAIAEGLRTKGTDPFGLAALYFALGDKDKGFEPLTRAFDQKVGFVRWANVDPAFDAVRSDPRFQSLISRLHLPSYRPQASGVRPQ
jgi:TolB-like protein/tetratricopeptide (TPR) repeat protein